tara:strand:+ start:118 stop:315 length:198 start_codon:yes stop_codon:yes gene_type:complete
MACDLLEEKSLPYKVINFLEDQEHILTEIKRIQNWKTVPMIFFKQGEESSFVGGYTDLYEALENE